MMGLPSKSCKPLSRRHLDTNTMPSFKGAKRKWQQMLGQEPEPDEEEGILAGVSRRRRERHMNRLSLSLSPISPSLPLFPSPSLPRAPSGRRSRRIASHLDFAQAHAFFFSPPYALLCSFNSRSFLARFFLVPRSIAPPPPPPPLTPLTPSLFLSPQFRKDADDCCSTYFKMSRKQRLYAFAYCLVAGFALSILVSAAALRLGPCSWLWRARKAGADAPWLTMRERERESRKRNGAGV